MACITRRWPRDAVDPQCVHRSDLRIRHSQELHDRELDVGSDCRREPTAVGDAEPWKLLCEGLRRWQPDDDVDRDCDSHAPLITRRRSRFAP